MNINDPRHPDFDLRTAKPDPRWLVSEPLNPADFGDTGDFFQRMQLYALDLQKQLKAQYPDETMELFVLMVEQGIRLRVVVGYGFSHNPLPDDSDTPGQ